MERDLNQIATLLRSFLNTLLRLTGMPKAVLLRLSIRWHHFAIGLLAVILWSMSRMVAIEQSMATDC